MPISPSEARARRSDPSTSHLAAQNVNVNRLETVVLMALLDTQATAVEISLATGIDKWSVSPRMKPLEDKGLVERRGTKRAPSGDGSRMSEQVVWGLTKIGECKARSIM